MVITAHIILKHKLDKHNIIYTKPQIQSMLKSLHNSFYYNAAPAPTADELAEIEFSIPQQSKRPSAFPQPSASFVFSRQPPKENGYASDCIGLNAYDNTYNKRRPTISTSKPKSCLQAMCEKLSCVRNKTRAQKLSVSMLRRSAAVLA